MPRPEKRTDYKHFPDAYSDLLLAFKEKGEYSLGPMKQSDAMNTRRDLYRYFGFLRAAYTTDELAKSLSDIARDATLKVEVIKDDEGVGDYYLSLTTNQIVLMMRREVESVLG